MYDERPVGGGVQIEFVESNEDFSHLSVEKLLVHSNWKARKTGYEKVIENPNRFKVDFLINCSKICNESNAAGLELLMKALRLLTPICNEEELNLLCKSALQLSLEKGLTGRPKTVTEAEFFIILLAENGQDIFSSILPFFLHRVPKNKLAAVRMSVLLVSEFGVQGFPLKKILSSSVPLLGDANAQVRKETIGLFCEVYKFIGESIRPFLVGARDIQIQELEKQFQGISAISEPKRMVKGADTSLPIQRSFVTEKDRLGECSDQHFQELDESPVISKLPKNFFVKALDKNLPWQDRCSLVNESLLPLLSQPRLKRDNYHELAWLMREYLVDPQAPLMLLGFKMIQECTRGLRGEFSSYSRGFLNPLFEKMKDKKTSVQEHVSLTLEKMILFRCITLDQCMDEIENGILSKNPTQRLSIINFCIRIIGKIEPRDIGKLAGSFLTLKRMVNDEKLENRETGYVLLAKLACLFGDNIYEEVVNSMEEKQKIRYLFFLGQNRDDSPAKAQYSSPAKKTMRVEGALNSSLPVDKINRNESRIRESAPRNIGNSTLNKVPKLNANPDDGISLEAALPHKDVVLTTMLGLSNGDTSILDLLRSKKWDQRCEGVEKLAGVVKLWTPSQCTKYFDFLVVYLRLHPGLKESTFQVFQAIRVVIHDVQSRAALFSMAAGYVLVSEYTSRLTEPKNKVAVRETFDIIANRFGPRFVSKHMMVAAAQIRTPKLLQEVNEYLTELISQYPANRITSSPLDIRGIFEFIKNPCLEVHAAHTRASCINLLLALHRHSATATAECIPILPVAMQNAFDAELQNMGGDSLNSTCKQFESTPICKRSRTTSLPSHSARVLNDSQTPHVSNPIFEEVKNCLRVVSAENDWKKRLEAVHRIEELFLSAKGEEEHQLSLPASLSDHAIKVLSTRFVETNRNFVVDVLRVIYLVVELSTPSSIQGVLQKVAMPPVLCMLGDQKANLRDEARNLCFISMNIVGLEGLLESLKKPLGLESNICRQNVLELMVHGFNSLSQDVALSKMRLAQLVPGVVTALMDRISEVRALAEQVVGLMIFHIGGEPFFRYIFQLKPADQNVVTPLVERQFQMNYQGGAGGLPHTNRASQRKESVSRNSTPLRTGNERSARNSSIGRDIMRSSRRNEESMERRTPSRGRENVAPSRGSSRPSSAASSRRSTPLRSTPLRRDSASRLKKPKKEEERVALAHCSAQEILEGLEAVDSSVALPICQVFLQQGIVDDSYGSVKIATAFVDRLVRNISNFDEPLVLNLCKCLNLLFSSPASAHKYQNSFLFQALGKLFDCLLSEKFIHCSTVIKSMNSTILKLLEGCPVDEVFSALLSCLASYSTTYLQTGRKEDLKYVQVTVKCIMRYNTENVSPETVVLCCHEYLLQHPPSAFKAVDDLPVRTVKTLLQNAARQFGRKILPIASALIGEDKLVTQFIRTCLEAKEKAAEHERHAKEESVQNQRLSTPKGISARRDLTTVDSSRSTHKVDEVEASKGSHVDPSSGIPSHVTLSSSRSLGPAAVSTSSTGKPNASQEAKMTNIFNKIRNYQTSAEGLDELFLCLKSENCDAAFEVQFKRCSEPFRLFLKQKMEKKVEQEKNGPRVKLPAILSNFS